MEAVNSATSALHIACLALGLGPGICSGPRRSPLWLQPTAASIAAPRLVVDIDPATGLMVWQCWQLLAQAERGLPKVVVLRDW